MVRDDGSSNQHTLNLPSAHDEAMELVALARERYPLIAAAILVALASRPDGESQQPVYDL